MSDPFVVIMNNKISLNQKLCDEVCQWPATGLWFSPGTPVSSTNITDSHDITEYCWSGVKHYNYNPNHNIFTMEG